LLLVKLHSLSAEHEAGSEVLTVPGAPRQKDATAFVLLLQILLLFSSFAGLCEVLQSCTATATGAGLLHGPTCCLL
jgi:hypothetical protein